MITICHCCGYKRHLYSQETRLFLKYEVELHCRILFLKTKEEVFFCTKQHELRMVPPLKGQQHQLQNKFLVPVKDTVIILDISFKMF